MRSKNAHSKQNHFKKYRGNNRKRDRKNRFPDQITTTADGCLVPKFCRGKHKPMTQDEALLENARKLFKNQQIRVIDTEEQCQDVVREIMSHCEEYNVIGLDCEFISQYYRHPVALLQLASHLKKIPHELQRLLEDESVLKVGIETFMDASYLVKDYSINSVASTLDLRSLAEKCDFQPLGLGRLSEEHLKVQLNKNACVSAAGWEDEDLKDIRIEYAAKDVHVSIELFKLFAEKLKPKPEDVDEKQHLQDFIKEHCVQHLNVKWTQPKRNPQPQNNLQERSNYSQRKHINADRKKYTASFTRHHSNNHFNAARNSNNHFNAARYSNNHFTARNSSNHFNEARNSKNHFNEARNSNNHFSEARNSNNHFNEARNSSAGKSWHHQKFRGRNITRKRF